MLSLAPQDPRRVIAVVRLEADAPVKTDTTAKLSQDGLTGPPFIQLTGGSPARRGWSHRPTTSCR